MIDRLAALCLAALSSAAPLAIAALGALATESAGSLSIAVEGSMVAGAFAAAAVGQASGSLALGLAAGASGGLLLSSLVAASALALRADVFVAGLAANLLAPGLVSMLSQAIYGTKGVLGSELMRTDPVAILAISAAALTLLALALSRTVFGLRLRASGQGDEAAKAAGISAPSYRFSAHLLAGASAGLAGATLVAGIGAYVPGMVTGRGWIALVAVFLGARKPLGAMGGSLLFGLLFAVSNLAQAFPGQGGASGTPAGYAELLQTLPFIATAVALIVWKRVARRERPGWQDSQNG